MAKQTNLQMLRQTAQRWARTATSGRRVLPDFLVIGAAKAGTTSLYYYLTQSPDVRRADRKEVHFFDHHYGRGESWYRTWFPLDEVGRDWVTGEASPYYLLHPAVPARVARLLPDVRLVALLRHPVARAYSQFQHSRSLGVEPEESFERALDLEAERTDRAWGELERSDAPETPAERASTRPLRVFSYVRRGKYAPQLRRWLDVFPPDTLLVLTAEELFAEPATVLGEVRRHLGLPPSSSVMMTFERRNARTYPEMPAHVRRRLGALFAEDVAEVEQLLGRPTGWRL